MYQCMYCWEFDRHYTECCRQCGCEAVVMVEVEDEQSNRYAKENTVIVE